MLAPAQTLAMALDPALILRAQGIEPDPWQRNLLLCAERQVLLLCSRGAGKSRTTSALALHTALFQPKSLVLLLSRAQRQSMELFRYVKEAYNAVGRPVGLVKETETQGELANGSRIVCLPGKEKTIRCLRGVALLVIDEAARVPDDFYRSVRPMLAISQGRPLRRPAGNARSPGIAWNALFAGEFLHPPAREPLTRILQARGRVLARQSGMVAENLRFRPAPRHQARQELYAQPRTANDRLADKNGNGRRNRTR